MNFNRSLIFAYLEEDNIQRAYFRVRPLLTLEGDVRAEAVQLWPAEGGLRIVPDRNEQHTFKNRMRTMGSFCVVDLRNQPAEAGKIRTNKNFRPDRGEVNQYILYSDTVHELPEHTFYHLIDGAAEDFASLAQQAITPLFYIRTADTLYGPVSKSVPVLPETAQEAAGVLFELPCPDDITRIILCMDDAPVKDSQQNVAAEPVTDQAVTPESEQNNPAAEQCETTVSAPAAEASLPIGETLQILDKNQTTDDALKELDQPVSSGANLLRQKESKPFAEGAPIPQTGSLAGTPLVRTPLHVSFQQNKNRTQEIVSNQWSVGKYEPPVQNLPAGAAMRHVQNPVEAACAQLRQAWNATSAHEQLMDCMLSLDGIRPKMEAKLCKGSHVSIMQRVLRERLQDLEAERLTALCELDKARRDVDAFKQELISGLSARLARDTGKLQADKKAAEASVEDLKKELNGLTLQRDALLDKVQELQHDILPEAVAKLAADARMASPVSGIPLRLTPVSGQLVDADGLIERLMAATAASGMTISRNTAIAALVLLAVSNRIGIACPTPAPAATLMKNLASAMGWKSSYAHQISAEQQPVVGIHPIDASPAILTTSLPHYAPVNGVTKFVLNRNASYLIRNAAYDANQWPVWMLPALPFIPNRSQDQAPIISAASIQQFAQKQFASSDELDTILTPILKAAAPLSGDAQQEMYRFISVCAGLMEGGLPVAVDWGIMLWLIPALESGTKNAAAVKALLDEYPLSLSKLQ